MVTSYIGIGSNLGNRKRNIQKAMELLKGSEAIGIEKVSSIYETEPMGGPAGQNNYLNGVIKIKTSLGPSALLKRLQDIEAALERRRAVRNGPRTLDLDILAYGRRVVAKPKLMIPHPLMDKRPFVLRGFCEIAPDFVHPLLKKSIREIYRGLN